MLFGVGVSCRILYAIVSYLFVSCSGSISSVGEEIANFLLSFTFCSERVILPFGAWNGLRYFIVALPVPSI